MCCGSTYLNDKGKKYMICPSCGFKTEKTYDCCPHCGRRFSPERHRIRIRLRLTPEEARSGTRRIIRLPGRDEPLRMKLPPDLRNGDVLEQRGIKLDIAGSPPVIVTLDSRLCGILSTDVHATVEWRDLYEYLA